MQDKGISETSFPRLLNDGTPTPAGIVAFSCWRARLAMINVANRSDTTTDIVDLQLTWNGGANSGTRPSNSTLTPHLFMLRTSNSSWKTATMTGPSSIESSTTS